MDDLISRQAAIDAIVTWTVEDRPDIEMPTDLVERINALPTAQTEIIHCGECARCQIDKVYHDYWCDGKKVWKDHYCGYAERITDG